LLTRRPRAHRLREPWQTEADGGRFAPHWRRPLLTEAGDQHERTYEIQAGSELADTYDQVLKHGESFAVFDRHGDIRQQGLGEEGIYHRGTRHLSSLVLHLGGHRPLLLGTSAKRDNARLAFDLTNTDLGHGTRRLPHSSVHLSRTKVLYDGVYHERLVLRSFVRRQVRMSLAIRYHSDFADLFEVRGVRRQAHGRSLRPVVTERGAVLRYVGLDGVVRRTRLSFSVAPDRIDAEEASFTLDVPSRRAVTIDLAVSCESGHTRRPSVPAFEEVAERSRAHLSGVLRGSARLGSSHALFNEWLDRSTADLAMLISKTPQGPYPYAGVPWFSTVFGRDGMVTALQTLWVAPNIARGVLAYLAANQADRSNPAADAEPGKILHEVRRGEMAALGEVPFARYYGSHDATPLFVMLVAAYVRHTDDGEAAARLWPHVERALQWVDVHGDPDGDGFLEYARTNERGLLQQGWKDSGDSIFHADGELAAGPIATCEMQGYAYAARIGAAELADRLGHTSVATDLRSRAEDLRGRFDAAFWDDELETYALALDGDKRPCRVRSSNAGHAMTTGIALPERADQLVATLMSDASFSGWGVRTVAAGEARYNPISYHNGSIWPHDNALVALGMARYGHPEAAAGILASLFEASRHFDLARLPELFCGFTRQPGGEPTRYPVACSPQAWAAGSVFMLLQAALGLEIDAPARQVRFRHSQLPELLETVYVRGLRVGDASLELAIERQPVGVGVRVLSRSGDVEVVGVS
jgi:glycogen debranching enzyme